MHKLFQTSTHHHKEIHVYVFIILLSVLKRWVGRRGFAVWQAVAVLLSSLLKQYYTWFARSPELLGVWGIRSSHRRWIQYTESQCTSFQWGTGSKAGWAVCGGQAFPSWRVDPVRNTDSCFLRCVSKNLLLRAEMTLEYRLLTLPGLVQTQRGHMPWPDGLFYILPLPFCSRKP